MKDKTSKLRIAQIAPLWLSVPPQTYGGIESLIASLSEEMVRRGHEVTLFGTGACTARVTDRVAIIPETLIDRMAASEAFSPPGYFNAALAAAIGRAADFDVIHCHLDLSTVPIASLSPIPVLYTLHSLPTLDDSWAMKNFPAVPVVGISRAQASAAPRPLDVVYNACDFASFSPSTAPGQYLAFLGRMSEMKNPLAAINAARACGMPLKLAGSPQSKSEEEYFEAKIRPHLGGEIEWLGPANHAQKEALMRGAAALLFPVTWPEPFGLVMIESMACGTPVVALRAGAVPEVIDEGVTGCIVAREEDLPAAVARAQKLDRATVRRHAESRFGMAAMCDGYEAQYRQLAEKGAHTSP